MSRQTFDLFAPRQADPAPPAAARAPSAPPTEEKKPLRVSELNERAAAVLEGQLGRVLVEGEISSFLPHRSGHWYFSLKDSNAQISCCCFKGSQRYITDRPKEGDHVIVRGKLTIYGPRGSYQMVIEHMKPAGAGALLEKLEALKQRLGAEGLFSAARKRPLPTLVRTVALVTSPDGAAVQDFIRVAHTRDPGLRIIVFPTPVQGAGAAAEIAKTIGHASSRAKAHGIDVIVVTRGGGSIEDLWAFNDESVVRAMVASTVPCVSAIGHEVDTTLSDYAADVRAPTPTAAAQITSPDMASVAAHFASREREIVKCLRAIVAKDRARIQHARFTLEDPRRRLMQHEQAFDLCMQEMEDALFARLKRAHHRIGKAVLALETHHPRQRLAADKARLETTRLRTDRATLALLEKRRSRLQRVATKLDALSPLSVLGRGYALVRDGEGRVVRKANTLEAGAHIRVRLEEGELTAQVLTTDRRERGAS
jgi:exodeoxyribonuclease VII large subunit